LDLLTGGAAGARVLNFGPAESSGGGGPQRARRVLDFGP
jgi:hypothetical protein